ncbi:unnamed protein product [Hydatigera taeniaeformis]|uniref:F-box domain-containing protein n=1 Tax=Hydatigena taeniaeformis TaxID=6205 RepID=A0A0R3X8J4_HYDTA|nr:unnamed protein product [Hydatigera taeniaeformis]
MKRVIAPSDRGQISKKTIKRSKGVFVEESSSGQNGHFLGCFPPEIVFRVFTFLEISDLSNVVFASRSGRMSVKHYLTSPVCTQLYSFRNPHPPNAPDNFVAVKEQLDYFSHVGLLFRRIYCFRPLSLRIQLLDSILRAVSLLILCILISSTRANSFMFIDEFRTFILPLSS